MHNLALFLTFVATSHALVLQTNLRDPVIPGSTQNVELVCKPRDTLEIQSQFKTPTKIQITKLDAFGEKNTVAELRRTNSTITKYFRDIIVSGKIDENEGLYLKVTWLVATEDTPGVFGCEISGIDLRDDFASLESDPLRIEEKGLTIKDVQRLISVATSEYEKKQKALEDENAKLRSYIDSELAGVRQQIQDENKSIRIEMFELKNITSSEYVTKNELLSLVSNLKSPTEHKNISDKQLDLDKFAALEDYIQNMSTALRQQTQSDVESLWSVISHLKNDTVLKYATRNELSSQLLHLKNFTRNEIASDNLQDQDKHDALKEFIQDIRISLQQQTQNDIERIRSEISVLINDTALKYATRNELSSQVANLKNFTKSEITSCTRNNQNTSDAMDTFVKNTVASLRQHIQENIKKVNSEISALEKDAASKYATKNELSLQVLFLKNFTKYEVTSDENHIQEHFNALYTFIRNVSKSLNSMYSEMKSDLLNTKSLINSTLHEDLIRQMNEALGSLIVKINSLDEKCENFIDQARKKDSHGETNTNEPSIPTTPTTTVSPRVSAITEISKTPANRRFTQWPDGNYGLVSIDGTVCPALAKPTLSKPGKEFASFIKITVRTARVNFELTNCWQKASSTPTSTSAWPKGSYCIAQGQKGCPKSFSSSHINYTILRAFNPVQYFFTKDKRYITTYTTLYCCRSDGPATTPIELPREREFYLYRYKNSCQTVQGMNIREDLITIERTKFLSAITAIKGGHHPDTSGDYKIHICHYHPIA